MKSTLVKDYTRCPYKEDKSYPCDKCDDPHDISPPCYVPADSIEENPMKFNDQIIMSRRGECGQLFIELAKALDTLAGLQQLLHATDPESPSEAHWKEIEKGQAGIDHIARQIYLALTGYDPGILLRDQRGKHRNEPSELVSGKVPGLQGREAEEWAIGDQTPRG